MTAKEAAKYLKINYTTLLEHAKEGRIPSFNIGFDKKLIRIRKEDLDKWIEQKIKKKEEQIRKRLEKLNRIKKPTVKEN